MRGPLGAIYSLLFTIFLNGYESTETRKIVDFYRSRRQALDQSVSPEGYTAFPEDDAAYKIYDGAITTPDEAQARCNLDGGNLVIADTPNKIRHIKSIYSGAEKQLFVAVLSKFVHTEEDKVYKVSLFALSIPWARQVYDETETNCADMFDFEIGFDGKDCTIKSFACSMTLIHYRTTVNGYKAYNPDNSIAYKIYNDVKSWTEARAQCNSDGGDLAIADTIEKIQFIQDMDVSKDNWFFIGIYKTSKPEIWDTVNKTKISISPTLWASWVPDDPTEGGKNCVAIPLSEIRLTTHDCVASLAFVCEIGNPIGTKPTIWNFMGNFTYPVGYIAYPHYAAAYKLYDEHLTHFESRKRCSADGGRLAVVNSFDKINAISKLLGNELVHIGIRMSTVDFDEWVIDSDGAPLKDIPWTLGSPHPIKCAALKKNANGLEDIECSQELQFLCEIHKSIN